MLVNKIENAIFALDSKIDRSRNDEKLLMAFQGGRDKLLKHYLKCNWVYCVSLVLDPRHKLESFDLTHWGRDLKNETLKKFKNIFKEQYCNEFSDEGNRNNDDDCRSDDDSININALYVQSNRSSRWDQEIIDYLNSPRASADTNVLAWWKAHSKVYVKLGKMARDIFSTMATSVPSERVFSNGSP